jgi:hypothetical protein
MRGDRFTPNDDSTSHLLTPFCLAGKPAHAGGLLGIGGMDAVVELLDRIHKEPAWPCWLTLAAETTDANAALFDVANQFAGCIAGIHEVLRRQGLLAGRWCLNPAEDLSPGQMEEIDRVYAAYPHLNDDDFVRQHLDEWLT